MIKNVCALSPETRLSEKFCQGDERLEKVLFVDDEPEILQGFRRFLRKHIEMYTATSGAQGLTMIRNHGPFAVIVCDMRMPFMDGISFFSKVRDLTPDSTRIMLTGVTDLKSTISAVNEGHIFRYLTKPCSPEMLHEAIDSGIAQYRNIVEERIRREEELRRLSMAIGQASDSILITDVHGTIVYANPTTSRLSGFTHDELLGSNLQIFRSDRHDESFYEEIRKALENGEAWKGHIKNRRKDGTVYETDTTISPVRNADGAVVNHILSARDVTYEMHLQAELQHAQKMESIGMLAGGIAHNFNNVMTAILAYAQLLQAQLKPEDDAQAFLEEIYNAGLRAVDMIHEILNFSRKVERIKKPVEVYPIVEEALRLISAAAPQSISIRHDLSIESGQTFGDSGQIHQVVMNLCTNAFHAMKGANGLLEVKVDHQYLPGMECAAGMVLKAGEYIRITVSDNGHGIDREIMGRIFLPFFTTKKDGEGTGLGLSTACTILKEHNGGISVVSEKGRGSTFTVYLPQIEGMDFGNNTAQ